MTIEPRTVADVEAHLDSVHAMKAAAAAQRIEDYITTILANTPELTDEQKNRLVNLIQKGTP